MRDNDYFVLDAGETTLPEQFQKAGYRTGAVLGSAVLAMTRRRADTVTQLSIEALERYGSSPFFLMVHYFDVHMYYDHPPAFARMHPGSLYDGEVSFVDSEIGRLLEALPDPGNTLVLVLADHGESQNEHGEPQHGFLLYESTLHVPLLVWGSGVPAGFCAGTR